MQSLPVRLIVVALVIAAVVVDGAGYWNRLVNHCPLTGPNCKLPPNLLGTDLYLHRGLDLSGGSRLVLQLDNMPKDSQKRKDDQSRAIAVITKRINTLGVNEPVVEPEGDNRIIVELAGVPADRAQAVIGKTGRLVYTTWVKDDSAGAASPVPGYKPKLTGLDGSMVASANAETDPNSGTQWRVHITMNSTGADIFSKLTSNAMNFQGQPENRIAIWLDLTQDDIDNWQTKASQLYQSPDHGGKLLTDPITEGVIAGGDSVITGNFTQQQATDLATGINSGSIPETITVQQVTDVGASLGDVTVKEAIAAGILGLLIVVIFMIVYYRLPGFLASLALLIYTGIAVMVWKVVPITLTLAGAAGFILSVGMAVDANVLIFERLKEEMRAGRLIEPAIEAAVKRAWPAIRDSNISTLITAAVLAYVGTGPVQGFAVLLMIGVAISMFSSIIVTQNLLAIVLEMKAFRNRWWLGVEGGRAV